MSKKTPKTILRLRVPKLNERGPLAFEAIFASLHGLLFKNRKKHGDESVAFEMAKIGGQIYFFAAVPPHLQTLICSQFYAQYPEVEIEKVPEFFTQKIIKNRKILAATLRPAKSMVFPFKRHPQFIDQNARVLEDPIGPISSAISHLFSREDSAVLQFVISPIAPDWHRPAEAALRRFFRNGVWQWDWWRIFYQNWRLDFSRKKRIFKTPIWGFLNLIGFGRAANLKNPQNFDETEDPDLDREAQTSGRHDRETIFSASFDKLSRPCFATNIRIFYATSDPDSSHAEAKIREIAGTFQQFSLPKMNHFRISTLASNLHSKTVQNIVARRPNRPFALSQEELATMFHLPTISVTTPAIAWSGARKIEPPPHLPGAENPENTILGQTNFRNAGEKFGIGPVDRRRHCYIIGKTGMGKSTLLENMIFADISAGKGIGLIDPHGDLADAVLRFVPKNRTNDVVLFDPADTEFPVAFNLLEGKNAAHRALIASGVVGVFKKLYAESWGPRLEHFLRNTILALVEAPDTTMLGIVRMLVDPIYRAKILHFVKDPMVQSFWKTEFSALAPQRLAEAVGPIQNKVGQFLSSPTVRNILGQPKSSLDLRFAMDSGKIVVINLSKGKLGEDNSAMLGSLLITKFQLDAMSRADLAEKDRRDFSLFVDEFQNFATDSFATILSEARKYKLALTMANQYVAQMSDEVRDAVFGNVGSLLSFQVGIDDAKVLAEQFDEERVLPIDLASLPKYQMYCRIMVEGMTTPVFSAATLPPPEISLAGGETLQMRAEKIRNFSRQRYARPREIVEEKITKWSRPEKEKGGKQDEKVKK